MERWEFDRVSLRWCKATDDLEVEAAAEQVRRSEAMEWFATPEAERRGLAPVISYKAADQWCTRIGGRMVPTTMADLSDRWGRDGWELVSVTPEVAGAANSASALHSVATNVHWLYFKRPLED